MIISLMRFFCGQRFGSGMVLQYTSKAAPIAESGILKFFSVTMFGHLNVQVVKSLSINRMDNSTK